MAAVFRDVVGELRETGETVLLSSHILDEVEALCDRVTMVRAERAVESGTFDELRHLTRTTVVVETARPIEGLSELPGVHGVALDGTRGRFGVDPGELNRVLDRLTAFDVPALTSSPPTLEELFLHEYEDDATATDGDAHAVARR